MPITNQRSISIGANPPLPVLRLGLLTVVAVAIHGYHLGVEDGEIYIPAAKKLLNPSLYPYAAEFFFSHARLSIFGFVLAWTARLLHLSMDWTVFLWYIATTFFLLVSCWLLTAKAFPAQCARWSSVMVITAVLTMPATNTGLLLMDPYLTARSFSTPLTLAALTCFVSHRHGLACFTTLLTALFHPQMAAYPVLLAVVLWLVELYAPAQQRQTAPVISCIAALPISFHLAPAQEPYREALYARDFFFLSNWTWYHWLGLLAPLAIMAWFAKGKLQGTTQAFQRLSFALIPFGVISILAAAVVSSSHSLDSLAPLQPLRCFHLITLIFMLFLGGVFGEYVAKTRPWAIAAVCIPLAVGMFFVNRATYPNSPHIEAPWSKTSPNAWVNTLLWIRTNTPTDAVFAVDSRYFKDEGVDVHGFRALSERSTLADYFKDSGVVAIFPNLAPEWKKMSNATYGLNHFRAGDFARLARQYPVTWTMIHGPAPDGIICPYQRDGYAVCIIPGIPQPVSK
jgi:hypothetical protein